MCRSVLEEVIEKRLKRLKVEALAEQRATDCTLGVMPGLAERPELRNHGIVPPEALHAAQTVNVIARIAVHKRLLIEREAWDCLTSARHALNCILK